MDKTDEAGNEKSETPIKPGSFREVDGGQIDKLAESILQQAKISEDSLKPKREPMPYSSDNLVMQYEFFRNNIYEPIRVFYPSCELDISPLRGFPNSQVVLMDKDKTVAERMMGSQIREFLFGDVLEYRPDQPFDLVIALNPCLTSRNLTRYLGVGGYVMANNWHDNASQLLEDPSFEGIGTIDRDKRGLYLVRGDFSRLEPEQFATYFYVFRKLAEPGN